MVLKPNIRCLKFLQGCFSCNSTYHLRYWNNIQRNAGSLNAVAVAIVLTACGIETVAPFGLSCCHILHDLQQHLPPAVLKLRKLFIDLNRHDILLQQHLPPAICAAECEAAEERSDDEAHTLQVPERSEGKTKVIRQQHLPFMVLKLN